MVCDVVELQVQLSLSSCSPFDCKRRIAWTDNCFFNDCDAGNVQLPFNAERRNTEARAGGVADTTGALQLSALTHNLVNATAFRPMDRAVAAGKSERRIVSGRFDQQSMSEWRQHCEKLRCRWGRCNRLTLHQPPRKLRA